MVKFPPEKKVIQPAQQRIAPPISKSTAPKKTEVKVQKPIADKRSHLPEKPIRPRESKRGLSMEKIRADSLAELLAAQSDCVALAIINGELVIAANELYKESNDQAITQKTIQTIASYFQQLCSIENQQAIGRTEVFQTICSQERINHLARQWLVIPDTLPPTAAERVIKYEEDLRTVMESEASGLVYAVCTKLRSDFERIGNSIKKRVQGSAPSLHGGSSSSSSSSFRGGSASLPSPSISALSAGAAHSTEVDPAEAFEPLFQSLAKFHSRNILKNETKEGVHAEMKILSYILDTVVEERVKKKESKEPLETIEIYIGISQLCCLHCKKMLDAANEIFRKKELNIILNTRGTHGLDFNWPCPKKFEGSYDSNNRAHFGKSSVDDIAYQIGILAKEKIDKELVETIRPKGIVRTASQSSSDAECDQDFSFRKQLQKLRNHKESLSLFPPEDGGIREKIDIAISLYENEKVRTFKSLWHAAQIGGIDVERYLLSIHTELTSLGSQIDKTKLWEVLQDHRLVTENISKNFKKVNVKLLEEGAASSPGFDNSSVFPPSLSNSSSSSSPSVSALLSVASPSSSSSSSSFFTSTSSNNASAALAPLSRSGINSSATLSSSSSSSTNPSLYGSKASPSFWRPSSSGTGLSSPLLSSSSDSVSSSSSSAVSSSSVHTSPSASSSSLLSSSSSTSTSSSSIPVVGNKKKPFAPPKKTGAPGPK